ncbi:ribonuclease Z [Ostreiculturibacter nitratireducens]|uniref:ribonuclease Z n=1 Tax=Ostreiculturibacter nitratireducens TaxID=3075226 RepID=UPI0031B5E252
MRPRFFPSLVNDRFGDAAVYVDFLMERRAIMFDLGDISGLPPREALRLSDVFVSHTHIDHFIGFDQLLRLYVGREKRIRLYGPPGFIDRVEAKLNGYTWNLTERFRVDLVFTVTEVAGSGEGRRARFGLRNSFCRQDEQDIQVRNGVLLDETSLRVRFAELEHRTPCLGFALQETEHVNVWKNRLAELGLTIGPWLNTMKAAIYDDLDDDTPIQVERTNSDTDTLPLGFLRENIVSITPGQKVAYVTDAAYNPANAASIVKLVKNADTLFIEATFARRDTEFASDRAHLTTKQAGELARAAGVKRVEPFHFSSRYTGEDETLLREVDDAFHGTSGDEAE